MQYIMYEFGQIQSIVDFVNKYIDWMLVYSFAYFHINVLILLLVNGVGAATVLRQLPDVPIPLNMYILLRGN